MPAEVGLFLPQLRMDFPTIEARVRLADQLGFHSIWFMDHLTPPGGPGYDCFEGWTVAAALARVTKRIHLGHLVLCDAFRHPALLAKMAATLDVVTEGRLELGLGWGSVPAEIERFGFGEATNRQRAARLGETLQILALMFSGEEFDFDGDFFTLRGAVGRPRPHAGRVPVHLGGAGEELTLPLVAEYADWWNCPSYGIARLDELRPQTGSAASPSSTPSASPPAVPTGTRSWPRPSALDSGAASSPAPPTKWPPPCGLRSIWGPSSSPSPSPTSPAGTLELFAAEVLPALRD